MSEPSFKIFKVRQYCYFRIESRTVTADQITAILGMQPDRATVRGSRSAAPRVHPANHSWVVECTEHGRIDQQVAAVLRRIEPISHLVRRLVDHDHVDAGLMMVRDFDAEDGGYNAMGWCLEPEQIALLAAMGAGVQSDEYLENGHPSEYGDNEWRWPS